MANEILEVLVRINLATAAAVALVFLVRAAVRRIAGARVSYALWLTVPVAAIGSLIPARKTFLELPRIADPAPILGERIGEIAVAGTPPVPAPAVFAVDWPAVAVGVWMAGMAAGVLWLLWRQRRFLRKVGLVERQGERVKSLAAGV